MTNDECLSRAFGALAHPIRVMVFRLLAEDLVNGAMFSDLQEVTGLPKRALTQHLRAMEDGGLLVWRGVSVVLTPGALLRASRLTQTILARGGTDEDEDLAAA